MTGRPDPLDTAGVIDALRKHGSTLWPAEAIPVEFTDWRRRTRAAARAANLRISVRRVSGMVFVEHLDHIVTEDQINAFGNIIAAHADGATLTWDQARRQAARQRLKPVPRDDAPPAQ